MKKTVCLLLCVFSVFLAVPVYAGWWSDIILLWQLLNVEQNISGQTANLLNVQKDQFKTQQDIRHLMQQMNTSLTGHAGWGNFQFTEHQSYGNGARDWQGVLQMAQAGQGGGALGGMIHGMAQQFPAETAAYDRAVTNKNSQRYYALQSQTVLASRAAGQLDYNRIQEQIAYQKVLQQQIDKTQDLKAAVDLLNRLQVEGNLIQLAVLRQAALANQQQAVKAQADVNTALTNAKFLMH